MAMLRAALYCRLSKDDMLQGDSESIKTHNLISFHRASRSLCCRAKCLL